MNPTQPYWTPPFQYTTRTNLKPVTNTLGFQFTIPWPETTTAGFYNGQGAIPGRKELVYRDDPEWFAVQNIIPSTAGVPRINPYDPVYKFDREKYTVRF